MNYAELTAAIESYLQNDFTSTEMATFVKQAEQRVYNSVQFANLRKNVTGSMTPNTPYLSAPTDFLSVYSMAVIKNDGQYVYMTNKDVNFIREVYPFPNSTGVPKYYGIFGPTVSLSSPTDELSFILGPTPDDNYDVELHYYYYPESIVDEGTSWLGDNFDSVLLYGSLVEAYTFLKGEADLMMLYDTKYKEA